MGAGRLLGLDRARPAVDTLRLHQQAYVNRVSKKAGALQGRHTGSRPDTDKIKGCAKGRANRGGPVSALLMRAVQFKKGGSQKETDVVR